MWFSRIQSKCIFETFFIHYPVHQRKFNRGFIALEPPLSFLYLFFHGQCILEASNCNEEGIHWIVTPFVSYYLRRINLPSRWCALWAGAKQSLWIEVIKKNPRGQLFRSTCDDLSCVFWIAKWTLSSDRDWANRTCHGVVWTQLFEKHTRGSWARPFEPNFAYIDRDEWRNQTTLAALKSRRGIGPFPRCIMEAFLLNFDPCVLTLLGFYRSWHNLSHLCILKRIKWTA